MSLSVTKKQNPKAYFFISQNSKKKTVCGLNNRQNCFQKEDGEDLESVSLIA